MNRPSLFDSVASFHYLIGPNRIAFAATCVQSFVPSFCKIVCTYPFTVPGLSMGTTAIAWFAKPLTIKRRIPFSREVSGLGIQ